MFGRRVFAAIIKYVKIMLHIRRFRCMHARLRAHTCTVMYMSAGRFLHNPGHDCICKSVGSGQYCMADIIASDNGGRNSRRHRPIATESGSDVYGIFLPQTVMPHKYSGYNCFVLHYETAFLSQCYSSGKLVSSIKQCIKENPFFKVIGNLFLGWQF